MKKGKLLFILAVTLTILTACGDNGQGKSAEQAETEMSGKAAETEEPDLGTAGNEENAVYAERIYETDIIYYNEASDGVHLRKDVEKTRTDYAVYYFEIPISAQERNACIAATDRMLSCVDARLPDIEVVVLQQKSYDGISVSGNHLYLSPQSWDPGIL